MLHVNTIRKVCLKTVGKYITGISAITLTHPCYGVLLQAVRETDINGTKERRICLPELHST
jgi:hypothetical protein